MNTINKIIAWICKITAILIGYILTLCLLFGWTEQILDHFFPELNGTYDLGKNLYLVNWRKNEYYLVCANAKDMYGKTCYGGIPIIPNQDSLNIEKEIIINEKHNEDWVIIRTILLNSKKYKYYIISKDYNPETIFDKYLVNEQDSLNEEQGFTNFDIILKKNLWQSTTYSDFIKECNKKYIDLKIK